MRSWDSRSQRFSFSYDTLRRPVDRTVSVSGGSEKLLGRIVYGDLLATPETTNHIGRVYRVYDGAGVATTVAFDFKGNPTSEQRQLVSDKTTQPDWSALLGESTIAAMATAAASLLDSETFEASSTRDAIGRVLVAISPDDSQVLYSYDEGGGLQKVELEHRGSTTLQTVIGDITYNARGQREQVIYGSTSSPTMTTSYGYDPQTYRLAHMSTIRESDDASLQGLHYHYDPVGNITDIRDTAQQTVYFQNAVVEAANSYEYDAVYRLIEATGREHASQGTSQRTHEQLPVGPQPMTSDPSAMRRYTQKYTYDSVGNILTMQHIPASGSGWTRYYQYDEDGNQLEATSAPGDDPEGPYTHTYSYDAHGSMTAMPHLSSMIWNHDDELQEVTVGTETVYFQYAGGMRSRKYTEKSGSTTEERIYLGGFEIYRKRVSGSLTLERESLHISDGTGRICLVETKTVGSGSPVVVWRYQLGNHLGSAATEVDEDGEVISYEEYHPYGTSAYRAVDSSVEVSAKRYRYTGMERDEETSLEYHSARYYVPWLGRWTASDPTGLGDGVNRFAYVGGNPVTLVDVEGTTAAPSSNTEDVVSHVNKRLSGPFVGDKKERQILDKLYSADDLRAVFFADVGIAPRDILRRFQGKEKDELKKLLATAVADMSYLANVESTDGIAFSPGMQWLASRPPNNADYPVGPPPSDAPLEYSTTTPVAGSPQQLGTTEIHDTPEAAAKAFGERFGALSVEENREYFAYIVQNGQGYSYTDPMKGPVPYWDPTVPTATGDQPQSMRVKNKMAEIGDIPADAVGTVHTHGAPDAWTDSSPSSTGGGRGGGDIQVWGDLFAKSNGQLNRHFIVLGSTERFGYGGWDVRFEMLDYIVDYSTETHKSRTGTSLATTSTHANLSMFRGQLGRKDLPKAPKRFKR